LTIAFAVLTNVLMIGAVLVMFALAAMLVRWSAPTHREQALRALAFCCGLLTVFGAKAVGVSITDLLARSLAEGTPFVLGFVGILLPGAVGAFLGWYFVRVAQRRENIGIRVLIFAAVLAITQFADVYATAIQSQGLDSPPSPQMAPNIAFVVGLCMYIILTYDPESQETPRGQMDGAAAALKSRVQERLKSRGGTPAVTTNGTQRATANDALAPDEAMAVLRERLTGEPATAAGQNAKGATDQTKREVVLAKEDGEKALDEEAMEAALDEEAERALDSRTERRFE
jgi:hypothetical protein